MLNAADVDWKSKSLDLHSKIIITEVSTSVGFLFVRCSAFEVIIFE